MIEEAPSAPTRNLQSISSLALSASEMLRLNPSLFLSALISFAFILVTSSGIRVSRKLSKARLSILR